MMPWDNEIRSSCISSYKPGSCKRHWFCAKF